jgi:hypothetical protein
MKGNPGQTAPFYVVTKPWRQVMKYVMSLGAIALLATACTVRTERTVIEKPVAPAPAAVVYETPPPTVVVPVR